MGRKALVGRGSGSLRMPTGTLPRVEVENGWLLAGSSALLLLFGTILVALAGSDVPLLAPFIGPFAVVAGLALSSGNTLGDTRNWMMRHHRTGSYAPVTLRRAGANEYRTEGMLR
jgi:hypothetical protein